MYNVFLVFCFLVWGFYSAWVSCLLFHVILWSFLLLSLVLSCITLVFWVLCPPVFYIQPTHSPVSCYFPIDSCANLFQTPFGLFSSAFLDSTVASILVGLCSFDRCLVLSAHTHHNLFSFCLFINIAGRIMPCLLGSGTHCHFYCHWPLSIATSVSVWRQIKNFFLHLKLHTARLHMLLPTVPR